jgi:hypothetical protein
MEYASVAEDDAECRLKCLQIRQISAVAADTGLDDGHIPRTSLAIKVDANRDDKMTNSSASMLLRSFHISRSAGLAVNTSESLDISQDAQKNLYLSCHSSFVALDRVNYISAKDLVHQLQYALCGECSGVLENATDNWKSPHAILLIDLSDSALFGKASIKSSVNAYFPPLVISRFKKKIFSSFNIQNFLIGTAGKVAYANWLKVGADRCIVVYDYDLKKDSDAYAFYTALTSGLKEDMIKGYKGTVKAVVLQGGLSRLLNNTSLASADIITFNSTNSDSSTEIRAVTIERPALSVWSKNVIDDPGAEEPHSAMLPHVTLFNMSSAILNNDTQESPPESAYDAAAPPDAFSKITKNLLVGSDQLPLAKDAIDQFKALKVTHILNMAAEIRNAAHVELSGQFQLKWIPVRDNTEQDMDDPLQEAIMFIGTLK